MNKKLLPVMAFLALGVGLVSNAMAKIGDLVTNEPSYANTAFIPEEEELVNVPVEIVFDDSGLVDVLEEEPEILDEKENVEETIAQVEESATEAVAQTTAEESAVESPVTEEPVTEEPQANTNNTSQVVPAVAVTPAQEVTGSITFNGKTLDILNVSTVGEDDEDESRKNYVKNYRNRFLYGHNTLNVLGGITPNKQIEEDALGEILSLAEVKVKRFTIELNGETKTYEVAKAVIFKKNMQTGRLELNGASSYKNKDYMNEIAKARFQGKKYDFAIMTCFGKSYPPRDASHRYVIFLKEV